jgi:hypothetical protein
MTYQVTRKYVPPPGSIQAPGEHYTLQRTAPDRRISPAAYRQYSFYRTPKGSEVAGDLGYAGDNYWRLDPDGCIFRELKAAVEEYDRREARNA